MASIKFICTSSAKLNDVPFNPGQIIFCQDVRHIYVDGTERVGYQEIIKLPTELSRQALSYPIRSFYFIDETKILWEFDGTWHQISYPPEKQIVFDDKDNFPVIGDHNTIYVDGLNMYRYIDDRYQLMNSGSGGGSVWVEI